MSQSDPTDHALAAIASILDQPESHREPEKPVVEEKPLAPEMVEAGGYWKVGPGPIASIRFKWTVRREGPGEYYVLETIGDNSAAIVSGPFTGEDAIRCVDERADEARRRYELIKTEMAGRSAAANMVRKDAGEV